MEEHDLHNFFRTTFDQIQNHYAQIQKRVGEDPGTAGDQGETTWKQVLEEWLPPKYRVITKGRIIGPKGQSSKQVDVLVLHPSYPSGLALESNYHPSSAVVAAFECKATLKAKHIKEGIAAAAKLREISPKMFGTPRKEICSPILFGILSHSHSWKSKSSTPVDNVRSILNEGYSGSSYTPIDLMDIVCVADLGIWNLWKFTNFVKPHAQGYKYKLSEKQAVMPTLVKKQPLGRISAIYMEATTQSNSTQAFSTIGALISTLYQKIALNDPELRGMADYFRLANFWGNGKGQEIQGWSAKSFYSGKVKKRFVEDNDVPVFQSPWDEWSHSII